MEYSVLVQFLLGCFGKAGGKRTDWMEGLSCVFVNLSNLIALLGFFHPRKSIELYFCAK